MYKLKFPIIDADTYKVAFQRVTQELATARALYGNTLAIASDSPTPSNIDATLQASLQVTTATDNFLKVRANMLELREAEVEVNGGVFSTEVGEASPQELLSAITGFEPNIRTEN